MDTKTLEAIKRLDFGKLWGKVELTIRDGKPTYMKCHPTIKNPTVANLNTLLDAMPYGQVIIEKQGNELKLISKEDTYKLD